MCIRDRNSEVVAVYCCVGARQTCERPLMLTFMGREDLEKGPRDREEGAQADHQCAVGACPAGSGRNRCVGVLPRAGAAQFQDYTGCVLAFSIPDIQIVRLQNPQLPNWAS
eukprot:12266085-Alexandrium_andersonii.AAC.1